MAADRGVVESKVVVGVGGEIGEDEIEIRVVGAVGSIGCGV